jgi:small nuclear ribonucleoprotein (snRNP)-like protein
VVVELKNDLAIRGTLHSVDQYINIKLTNTEVVEKERFPQLVRCAFPPWRCLN